jgi:hypothetical protein
MLVKASSLLFNPKFASPFPLQEKLFPAFGTVQFPVPVSPSQVPASPPKSMPPPPQKKKVENKARATRDSSIWLRVCVCVG